MIQKLENLLKKSSANPVQWLLGISGIFMVRFFLEAFSSNTSSGIIASDASTLVHYYLFFMGVALSTMIFLYFAIPNWRQYLPQFVSLAFLIILIAPLADFIISKAIVKDSGFTMAYLFDSPKQLLHSFFTFFGPNWKHGITIGIRIELALILIFTGFLIYKIRRNLIKTIAFVILLYIIVFAFGALPSLISIGSGGDPTIFLGKSIVASATFTDNLHTTLLYSSATRALEIGFNFLMAKILFLVCLILTFVYFYLNQKTKLVSIIKNSRPERISAYFTVIFFGMLLAHFIAPSIIFMWSDYISIVILLLSFYFSWMFAVCTNDIADQEIDLISNSSRPLITGNLSISDLKQSSCIFLITSLIAGYLSGFYAFFYILAFTALYYIYSMPPTRFKQIPFFSSFLISLCKLSCALAGFFLISSSKVLAIFPTEAIVGIIVFFTLFTNIRDLKDIEGDRAGGIKTLAVLFGPKFVGILIALAYLLLPLFFSIPYLYITSLPAALLSYYFCIRKPYKEFPLFIIYFSSILLFALILSQIF